MEMSLINADTQWARPSVQRASLVQLPKTALLVIWRHLEFQNLKAAACVCRRLHQHARSMPLQHIGTPMVLSQHLSHRLQEAPGAEAALLRFRARRTLLFVVYLLLTFFIPPVALVCYRPGSWSWTHDEEGVNGWIMLTGIYSALLAAWGIAAFTPLRSSGRGRYFQLRATEEYYTDSQWAMVRRIWITYATSALFCPLVCIDSPVSIIMGLASPVFAAIGGVLAVRREFPSGAPLRESMSIQAFGFSALIFFVLAAAASHWEEATEGASHLGFVVGAMWCVLIYRTAPKVIRQLQEQSTSTWPPAGPPVPASSTNAAFAARRRNQLRLALIFSRIAVLWGSIICIFLLMRWPPPTLLLALPEISSVALVSGWLLFRMRCS